MRFAFPTEAAIKGFIDLAIKKGGMSLTNVDAVGAPDDAANVALMEAGRADFQVGSVPSRMTLQIAGFEPILTSGDIAAYASATADSIELRAAFHDGWLATDEWIEANYETVLCLASVGFRVNQYINDHPDMAAAVHTPFLNRVAGTTFEDSVANVAYTSLDPFWTFDAQTGWIVDETNPLNAQHAIGSAIKVYEEQGLFSEGEFAWDNFTLAHKVYADLLDRRNRAEALIAELDGKELSENASDLLAKAKAGYGTGLQRHDFVSGIRSCTHKVERDFLSGADAIQASKQRELEDAGPTRSDGCGMGDHLAVAA